MRSPTFFCGGDQSQQVADLAMSLDGMSESLVRHDPITIVSPDLFSLEKPALDQIEHDALHSPLGDPNLLRDLAHDDLRMLMKQNQHVAMVGQKRPAMPAFASRFA